ncbi:hypothetical protein [Limnoglobus roseus]|uniref:Uncharacterized protein n=1 Tax=Limnoglobus roseus TaxID=2598579 RepID=A0A5C1A897_9BACT|nr:hypothetical protein [Limnoglobus roseus]QEL13992.1 hypothetical protein PX52LOC_00853 [Limnoglobus roseus]
MSDGYRKRRPKRRRSSNPAGMVVAFLALGAVAVGLGVGIQFLSSRPAPQAPAGGEPGLFPGFPIPNVPAIAAPNLLPTKVTAENFKLLRTGFTLAQVEAVLGPGRPATRADLAAIFGDHAPAFPKPDDIRTPWENGVFFGAAYAWADGTNIILVQFLGAPTQGGRLGGKLLRTPEGTLSQFGG